MARRAPFSGKVAVVTGAASGIGRALAAELVGQGAQVLLTDVDGPAVTAASAALAGSTARRLDVTDRAAVQAVVDEVVAEHGQLDLFISNAGITMGGPTHELTGAHWDRMVDVNLGGVINGLLAAYPQMVHQGHGQLVATASGAGLAAPPLVVPYAATKHAVVGLCTGLRAEASLLGVKVNVLCPGSIDTPILDRLPDPDLPATASAPVTPRAYLGVLRQKPTDVDAFARGAVRQLARNRGIIALPFQARSLWYLHRLSPRAVATISRSLAKKVMNDLVHPA
jgi:NAD(P)-dependent dehydrogenase (short-subunit alcohol dehydrogenase family)